MGGFFNSSIGRKVAMALSAFFLMFFLIIHLTVNLTSLFSEDIFNDFSHFMGTNPLVQFALQPVLIIWCCISFCDGICFGISKTEEQLVLVMQKIKVVQIQPG